MREPDEREALEFACAIAGSAGGGLPVVTVRGTPTGPGRPTWAVPVQGAAA